MITLQNHQAPRNNSGAAPQFYPVAPTTPAHQFVTPRAILKQQRSEAKARAREAARVLAKQFDVLAEMPGVEAVVTPVPCFDIAGSTNGGHILGRLLYWHRTAKNGDTRLRVERRGQMWVACGLDAWWEMLRLSVAQASAAIDALEALGVIEVIRSQFDGLNVQHIRLIEDAFEKLWKHAVENPNQNGTFKPRARNKIAVSNPAKSAIRNEQKATFEPGTLGDSLTGVTPKASKSKQHRAREKSQAPGAPVVAEVATLECSQRLETAPLPMLSEQFEPQVLAAADASDASQTATPAAADSAAAAFVALLIAQGVKPATARDLVAAHPAEVVRLQLEYLPHREAKNPAALLVKAIRENWEAPTGYEAQSHTDEAAERERARDEAARREAGQWAAVARARREKAPEKARQQTPEPKPAPVAAEDEAAQLDAMWEAMDEKQRQRIESVARERLGVLGRSGRAVAAMDAMRRNLMREKLQGIPPAPRCSHDFPQLSAVEAANVKRAMSEA